MTVTRALTSPSDGSSSAETDARCWIVVVVVVLPGLLPSHAPASIAMTRDIKTIIETRTSVVFWITIPFFPAILSDSYCRIRYKSVPHACFKSGLLIFFVKVKKDVKDHMERERNPQTGSLLRQVILGGQDGLVNVLGLILGVAAATNDSRIIIIAGLAATMAESISMAAVAYTSSKAEKDYYKKQVEQEKKEIREIPEMEREEVKIIYYKKGFRGKQLNDIVRKITSNKKLWLDVMMSEELGLAESKSKKPVTEGVVVGVSAVIGSVIPLAPFFFLPVSTAAVWGLVTSTVALFIFGAIKSRLTIGSWVRSGLELAVVGTVAAVLGYLIGVFLGAEV